MADFSRAAPAEAQKSTEVHDRGARPDAPPSRLTATLRNNVGMLLGFAFAMGFMALAFQTRATWDSHRDWVVPVTVPFWAIGGVALGHLLGRRQFVATGPALLLLMLAMVLTALNIWRGAETDGGDGLRDAMTIATAVLLTLALLALLGALVWLEAKHPTKAPPAEVPSP
ncbi:MAG: hypothetical protein ACR2HN_11250 [Tepidiformaceae bacterium]